MAKKLFAIVFILNYIIMGLGRYYTLPLPVSVTMELSFILLIVVMAADKKILKSDWSRLSNPCLFIYAVWLAYCTFQIVNSTCNNADIGAWFKDYRNVAILMLYPMIIMPVMFRDKKGMKFFIFLWGVMTLLATAKGYYQKNRGFDPYEMNWLMTYGRRTHFIITGIRYFSFFTDAANYGCNMAATMVSFGILAFSTKKLKEKLFYLLVMVGAGYGMLISGTRSAILVAGFGIAMYMFLSKNFKMFSISGFAFLVIICGLKFTNVGDGNRMIHRMRTAFDPNDPSKAVRDMNRAKIAKYMSDAPIGIGLGRDVTNVPVNNKYYVVAITPPDSTQVYIWVHTGIIGLWLYMGVMIALVLAGGYVILFKIRDKELRQMLSAFLTGFACMIIAGYGNQVTTQYPNNLIFFGAVALVFSGVIVDKEISERKAEETKQIEE
ncbi:MAG: O-antigen ligase family protein [Bacteroidaceae bacterium]|nr:O-antigen ligase family protein [Bacteroidaceae bacterium]